MVAVVFLRTTLRMISLSAFVLIVGALALLLILSALLRTRQKVLFVVISEVIDRLFVDLNLGFGHSAYIF